MIERRSVLQAGLATAVAGLAPASVLVAAPAVAAPRVGRTLARGIDYPWGIDFLPDGSALVTERNSGRVLRVRPGGGYSVVGRVAGTYNDGGEGGLLGLALSPSFAQDRWVYAFVTTTSENRIVRMQYDGTTLTAPQPLLTGIPRGRSHNGGGLWFGLRGALLASTGDTRDSSLAQDKSSLAGKILRLNTDGSPHPDNPFGNYAYTFGHRNPEGITIDWKGRIWASEFGENTWDELNHIRRGHNYGWPRSEGRDGRGGYTDPFVQWHPENCSPSGTAILAGRAWIGALRGESLWSVDLRGGHPRTKTRHFHGRFGRIRLVKRAPDRSLWIGTSNGDHQDRIVRVTL